MSWFPVEDRSLSASSPVVPAAPPLAELGARPEGHRNSDHARDLPIHESVLERTPQGRRGSSMRETLKRLLQKPRVRLDRHYILGDNAMAPQHDVAAVPIDRFVQQALKGAFIRLGSLTSGFFFITGSAWHGTPGRGRKTSRPRLVSGRCIAARQLLTRRGCPADRRDPVMASGHVRQAGVIPQRHPDHQLAATSSPLTSSIASPSITSSLALASDSGLM